MFLADELKLADWEASEEALAQTWSAAIGLPPQQAEDFLSGMIDRMDRSLMPYEPYWPRCSETSQDLARECVDKLVSLYCRSTPWGTRPLCPLVGVRLAAVEHPDGLLEDPRDLFESPDQWGFDSLVPGLQEEFVRGAGRVHGYVHGPNVLRRQELKSWPEDLRGVYVEGWKSGQRFRWRDASSWPPPYTPQTLP
jgi:hypothetical protein